MEPRNRNRHWRAISCVVVLFALLGSPCRARAADAGDFEKANDLYDGGKFAEAKQTYGRIVESGSWSANLFYNLGNAEFRADSPGRAILNYERALAIEPRHPEALANLKLLRERTHAGAMASSLPERVVARVDLNMWIVAAAVAAWFALFCVVVALTRERRGNAGLWAAAIVALVFAGVAGFAISLHARDRALAIVTAKEVEARLAPAETAGLAQVLPAGSRVRVLSERGPWTYCELPENRRGWIASASIARVHIGGT